MKIDHDSKIDRIQEIWNNTKFVEVDELGFYHFEIKCTEKKIIDFAIEPSLAVIYKNLIREMEKMHKTKRRQSYVETDEFQTPFTSISKAVDPIKNLEKAISNFSKDDKPTAS